MEEIDNDRFGVSHLVGYLKEGGFRWYEYDFHEHKSWIVRGDVSIVTHKNTIIHGLRNQIHKDDGPAIEWDSGLNEWFYYGKEVTPEMNQFCKDSDIDPRNMNTNEKILVEIKLSSMKGN